VRLLVLGGTKFVGRALVADALARGHEVTLFNRGTTNPDLFPEVERLRGDREHDVSTLDGKSFDAVVDTSGYVPKAVRASARALSGSALYVFVSSVSVYADFSSGRDEDSPTAELGDDSADELRADYANYGALKALCEDEARAVFGSRALLIRPGLIVGPADPTGRFTYWPHRIARGGDVLVPAPPDERVQFIDVRDLGEWIVRLCERGEGGTYNATNTGIPWAELVETCRKVAGRNARFVWVPGAFLAEQGVGQWMELPLWIDDREERGLHSTDVSRAVAAGLVFRPLEETVAATLAGAETTDTAGLSPAREAELLAAWERRAA
jgi:2'-hydroxyisoflavone reductase